MRIRDRRLTVLLLLALGLLASAAPAAPDLLPRLARLGDDGPDDPAWERLDLHERIELLRGGLGSDDPAVALLCARLLPAEALALDELRLKAAILALHPDLLSDPGGNDWGLPDGAIALGIPEMPALWRTLASRPGEPGTGDRIREWHRAAVPGQIADLVPLLETADAEVFGGLVMNLSLLANCGEPPFEATARGLVYALARLRAERAGKPRPKLADVRLDLEGDGLPGTFVALARGSWELEPDGFRIGLDVPLSEYPPIAWLHRWAKRLRALPEDLPFLVEVARKGGRWDYARAWAIRELERLGGEEAGAVFADLATSGEPVAAFVAAALARAGKPEAFEACLGAGREHAEELLFQLDPERAVARHVRLLRAEPGIGPALDPLSRWQLEDLYEIRIARQTLERLLRGAIDAPLPGPVVLEILDETGLDVTPAIAAAVLDQLRPPLEPSLFEWARTDPSLFARLHAAAPEAVDRFLRRLEASAGAPSDFATQTRACLGEDRLAAEYVESWPRLADAWEETWDIGRVRTREVERLLVREAHGKRAEAALAALAVFRGIPPRLRFAFEKPGGDIELEGWDEARDLLVEGRGIPALLRILDADPDECMIARIGLIRDPAVTTYLRRFRAQRERCRYWPATAGLALAGDAEARREWLAFLSDGRTWMLDDILDGVATTLDGDPDAVRIQIGHLSTNCCLWFHAKAALMECYAGIPVDQSTADFGSMRGRVASWIERHAGRFRRSPLSDGLVVGPDR